MTTMRKRPKYCEDQAFIQYSRWLWFQFSSFLLLYIAALEISKKFCMCATIRDLTLIQSIQRFNLGIVSFKISILIHLNMCACHSFTIKYRVEWKLTSSLKEILAKLSRRTKDGRGIGQGDHFLPYKSIERTIEH